MNQKKIAARELRLARARAELEAFRKTLEHKGLDAKAMAKNAVLRHLQAEVRKISRSLEALRREPPKPAAVQAPEKSEKPPKEAAPAKAPKAPKEKKPKAEASQEQK